MVRTVRTWIENGIQNAGDRLISCWFALYSARFLLFITLASSSSAALPSLSPARCCISFISRSKKREKANSKTTTKIVASQSVVNFRSPFAVKIGLEIHRGLIVFLLYVYIFISIIHMLFFFVFAARCGTFAYTKRLCSYVCVCVCARLQCACFWLVFTLDIDQFMHRQFYSRVLFCECIRHTWCFYTIHIYRFRYTAGLLLFSIQLEFLEYESFCWLFVLNLSVHGQHI